MDSTTATTDDLNQSTNAMQENLLLDIVKETCEDPLSSLSDELKGKVNRIIADCNLSHYSGLHKLSTADESTATVLGLMNQTTKELSFDEQTELNQGIINAIRHKLPKFTAELEQLSHTNMSTTKSRQDRMKELQDSLDDKLKCLEEQENEKVDLMMQWLNHRLQDVAKFGDSSSDLLNLKTKILELKSKILHLQILQNIFTETNQSIKAYNEVYKDLKGDIKDTEERIKHLNDISQSAIN